MISEQITALKFKKPKVQKKKLLFFVPSFYFVCGMRKLIKKQFLKKASEYQSPEEEVLTYKIGYLNNKKRILKQTLANFILLDDHEVVYFHL